MSLSEVLLEQPPSAYTASPPAATTASRAAVTPKKSTPRTTPPAKPVANRPTAPPVLVTPKPYLLQLRSAPRSSPAASKRSSPHVPDDAYWSQCRDTEASFGLSLSLPSSSSLFARILAHSPSEGEGDEMEVARGEQGCSVLESTSDPQQ